MAGWFNSHAPVGNGYRVPDYLAWVAEPDGSVVLADLRTGRRHSLAPTGGLIWEMTVTGSAPDAIEGEIREAFRDAPDDVAQVIDDLRESLSDAGLLESRPSP